MADPQPLHPAGADADPPEESPVAILLRQLSEDVLYLGEAKDALKQWKR